MFDVKNPSPRDRMIVALDVASPDEARSAVQELGDAVSFYKLGFQLLYGGGFDLVKELTGEGKQVFIDLKLLDIDNTVMKGVESLSKLGGTFLTIHAYPKAMAAAVAARANGLNLLGVTVMTNLDNDDLKNAGYRDKAGELVIKRAHQAKTAGMDGVVCSAAESSAIRAMVGNDLLLVTPGIRPAGVSADDQKRIVTPKDAINAGSDYLVVGRPVMAAENRVKAANSIVAEIEEALDG